MCGTFEISLEKKVYPAHPTCPTHPTNPTRPTHPVCPIRLSDAGNTVVKGRELAQPGPHTAYIVLADRNIVEKADLVAGSLSVTSRGIKSLAMMAFLWGKSA